MFAFRWNVVAALVVAFMAAYGSARAEDLSYAYVTNGVAGFWDIAAMGAKAAGKDLGVHVDVIMPSSMADQTRKIEDLLTRGTDGIAISPIDPNNQIEILNKAASKTNLITQDSDAPQTERLMYIGMDNYDAGLLCGGTLRKAMPNGGTVMIFIGRMDQDNSKRRRQGVIDSLLGRKPDAKRYDPPGQPLKSKDGKFTVLGTMTDQFDRAKAKANAEDAITRHPNLTAMVGLFEYNPQMILEALDRLGKLEKVAVMGFDENPVMLEGIKEGYVVGTVVQNPFKYGYESVKTLHALKKGDKSVIPKNKFVDIPARVIDASNVEAFQRAMEKRLQNQ